MCRNLFVYFIIYLCACTRMHVLHVVCMCVHSPGAFSYALLCVSVHGILMCMCAGEVRLANSPREYLIVSHFRGSKEDTELQVEDAYAHMHTCMHTTTMHNHFTQSPYTTTTNLHKHTHTYTYAYSHLNTACSCGDKSREGVRHGNRHEDLHR